MKFTSESRIKLNLQFFADPAGESGSENGDEQVSSDDTSNTNTDDSKESEKKYSDADVNRIVNEKYAKFEAQKQKEVDEAKKLAKMNKDDKNKYEIDKLKSDAQSARDELAKYQMRDTAKQMIVDGGYSATDDMIDLVTASDADTTKTNVGRAISWAKSIREQVTKELSQGTTPRTNGVTAMTKDEIMAIPDMTERQEQIAKHMDLFL